MIYKIIYVDDGIKEYYPDAEEIIISFYGLVSLDENITEEIDNLIYTHPKTKIYFTNLNEMVEIQACHLWNEIEILK